MGYLKAQMVADASFLFTFVGSFDEKEVPKQAGFRWHGGNCRPGCPACKAGLGKVWWTDRTATAALLSDLADPSAEFALADHNKAVEASKAADATVNLPCPNGLAYMPFQKAGVAFMRDRKATLLADEQGLGKTIEVCSVVNADESIRRVLVVCPASLKLNWKREMEKWLICPMTYWVSSKVRVPIDATASVVIVNYDRFAGRGAEEFIKALSALPFDLVVLDEAHVVKNDKAQRTKALLGYYDKPTKRNVPGIVSTIERRIFATGTPVLNKPKELFPILQALDPASYSNFMGFAKRYCAAHQEEILVKGGHGRTKLVWNFDGSSHLDELQERLRGSIMVRRLKMDVLKELPAKIRQIIPITPEGYEDVIDAENEVWGKHEEAVTQAELDMALALAAGDQTAYLEAAARLRKAHQVAFEEMAFVRHQVALAKIPQVIEIVENDVEASGKVIVMAHHHDVVDAIAGHFGDAAVVVTGETPVSARQKAVDRFQTDPSCTVFVGNIRAAGVGITLTASSTVIFAELDWVPAWVTQAEDRPHRIGQDNVVVIKHVVFDGSLDSKMVETLIQKQQIADSALDTDHRGQYLEQADKLATLAKANEARRALWGSDRDQQAVERAERKLGARSASEDDLPVEVTAHSLPLLSEYPKATQSERDAAAYVTMYLAGLCDFAQARDGKGFNKPDSYVGHALARVANHRELTDGEVHIVKELCRKYSATQCREDKALAAARVLGWV